MRRFAAAKDWHPLVGEDVYFAMKCTEDADCAVCPFDVATEFVVEKRHRAFFFLRTPPWAFHKNVKYGGEPICAFNRHLATLQQSEPQSESARAAPDVLEWEPVVTHAGSREYLLGVTTLGV
jgi:hypothetical protein